MTPADSDALAQAASFRMHLTTIGYDYLLHRQLFAEFLDAVVALADQVPSLTFCGRTDAQIEFSYLGQPYCIRHRYDGESKTSTLSSLSKSLPEDGNSSLKRTLTMDKAGNLARPNEKPLWSVRGGSERAFYYLLLGQ
jgi:hypothetical protein